MLTSVIHKYMHIVDTFTHRSHHVVIACVKRVRGAVGSKDLAILYAMHGVDVRIASAKIKLIFSLTV